MRDLCTTFVQIPPAAAHAGIDHIPIPTRSSIALEHGEGAPPATSNARIGDATPASKGAG